jgi:hypothetical protein
MTTETSLTKKDENEIYKYENDFFPPDKDWKRLCEQCSMLVKTGFLPSSIKTTEQAIAICLMGRELGLAPMTSLTNISVINQKPVLEAKLMLALIYKRFPDAHVAILENTTEQAAVEFGRGPDKPKSRFTFSIKQAMDNGLLSKDNWKKYPADMLLWRAMSRGAKAVFPDVFTVTAHTPDEMETITLQPVRQYEPDECDYITKDPRKFMLDSEKEQRKKNDLMKKLDEKMSMSSNTNSHIIG